MKIVKKNTFEEKKPTIVVGFGSPLSLRNASKHSYITYTYWLTKFKDRYNLAMLTDFENQNHVSRHDDYLNNIFDVLIMNQKKEIQTWQGFIDESKSGYSELKNSINVVSFIEIFGIMTSAFKFRKPKNLNKTIKENKLINFISAQKMIRKFLNHFAFVSSMNIPWNHFLHDPQESNHSDVELMNGIDYRRFFIYDSQLFKTKGHPFLKIYHTDHLKINEEKKYDWCIGFTCLTPDRKYIQKLYDIFYGLPNSNVFLQDKYKEIYTNITKEDYIDYLKKSKYTVILPGYDKKAFSPRFMEALTRGVIPYIHNSVYTKEGIIDQDILNELLIDDSFDISNKLKDVNFLQKLIDKYVISSEQEIKLSIEEIL
jgi:hypothetical protein